MIVTLERLMHGLILCEVETEEEAFDEIAYFLEVNNIPAEQAAVYDRSTEFLPTDKDPTSPCKVIYAGGIKFGINDRYSDRLFEFEPDETKWDLEHLLFFVDNKFTSRREQIIAYFDDLKKRMEVQ